MKIISALFPILLIFVFVDLTNAQNCSETDDLPNFGCVNEHIFRGAQPTEAGVRELAEKGVRMIISLRGTGEKTRTEEVWAQENGMKFISIPLSNWREPKDAKIREIMNLLDTAAKEPVFIHCQRGADRTGTVVAFYRMTREGWTRQQANVEAKEYGRGWWQLKMKDYLEDYSKDIKKGKDRGLEPN